MTDDGRIASWTAEHDGYARLRPPAGHRRSVRMDRDAQSIEITDTLSGGDHGVRLAFHLGPDVHAELDDGGALLTWPAIGGRPSPVRLTRRGLSCRGGCGGACTEAIPLPSSAGIRRASGVGFPLSPSWEKGTTARAQRW